MTTSMQQVEPISKDFAKNLADIFKKRLYERNLKFKEQIVESLNNFDFFIRRVDCDDYTKVILDVSRYLELKNHKVGDILYEKDDESKFIGFVLSGRFGKYDLIDPSPTLGKQLRAKESNKNDPSVEQKRNSEQKEAGSLLKLELVQANEPNVLKITEKTDETKKAQVESAENCMHKLPSSPRTSSVRISRPSAKKFKIVPEKQELTNTEDCEILNLVNENQELSKYMAEKGPLIKRIKTVAAGESFGERSLTKNQSRSNTVICIENGYILRLSETNFNKFFQEKQDEEEVEKINFFVNVFKNMSYERIKRLVYHFSQVTINPKKVLYSEGDTTDALYFVKEGSVSLFKNYQAPPLTEEDLILGKTEEKPLYSYRHPGLKDSKMMPLCSVGLLGFFGEEVVQKQNVRQYTAVTDTPIVIYKLRAKTYYRFERQLRGIKKHIDEKSAVQDEWRNDNILQKHVQAKDNINNEMERTRPIIHTVKVRVQSPKTNSSRQANEDHVYIINGCKVKKKSTQSFGLDKKGEIRNYKVREVIDWRKIQERGKREASEESRISVLSNDVAKFLKYNYRAHSASKKNLIEEGTKYDLELINNPAPVGKIPFLWEPHVLYFPKPKLTFQFDHSNINANKPPRPTTAAVTGAYGRGKERPSSRSKKIVTTCGSQSSRTSQSNDMVNNSTNLNSKSYINLQSISGGSRFSLTNSSSTTSLIIKSYTKAPEMNPKIIANLQKIVKADPRQKIAEANKRPCVSLNNLDEYDFGELTSRATAQRGHIKSPEANSISVSDLSLLKTPRSNRTPSFPKQLLNKSFAK